MGIFSWINGLVKSPTMKQCNVMWLSSSIRCVVDQHSIIYGVEYLSIYKTRIMFHFIAFRIH